MSSPNSITLTRPDDWHVHLRDGAALANRPDQTWSRRCDLFARQPVKIAARRERRHAQAHGLAAARRGECDLAPLHLLDEKTGVSQSNGTCTVT